MRCREQYFYVWPLYVKAENLKYVTLRDQQMEKIYTKFERIIVTNAEVIRAGNLFYHWRMCLVMVGYELMF
jgi:hypothetical protein